MRDFTRLEIWKLGMEVTSEIYKISKLLPDTERYGLMSQMTRAAVSIPSNISEGCRGSKRELVQFVKIAIGSANELETQLRICRRICYLSDEEVSRLVKVVIKLRSSMINFIRFVKQNN
jgi:four helix bundle protein